MPPLQQPRGSVSTNDTLSSAYRPVSQGPGMGGPLVSVAVVVRMLSQMWKKPVRTETVIFHPVPTLLL